MKGVFLTFSSNKSNQSNQFIKKIITLLDSNNRFKISHRWFDKQLKDVDMYKIYEKSIHELLNSELVVAEASVPSTGVGQQIAFAMLHKIPVLVLVKDSLKEKKISLFSKGIKSTQVSFFYYKDKGDLEKNLIPLIESKIDDGFEKLNFMATKSIKKLLAEQSKKQKISQSELLRRIIMEWKSEENII